MNSNPAYTPLEEPVATATDRRQWVVGIPATLPDYPDRRLPLTPEGVAMLQQSGINVRVQTNAGINIHYPDAAYSRAGALIDSRTSVLSADIVVSIAPLSPSDIRQMRRGSLLLTLFGSAIASPESLREILRNHITVIALDRIADTAGHAPFADTLHEIEGRAAMSLCSSMLARGDHGKGILLGGVAGVVACEVTIIGSDIAACAAASSALGLGATVRMLDNDIYSLREVPRRAGAGVVTSTLHPHVVDNALRSADIVIATTVNPPHPLGADHVALMKRGVIAIDLTDSGTAFPSLPEADISSAITQCPPTSADIPRCYRGIHNTVLRTTAMALTNAIVPLLHQLASSSQIAASLRLSPHLAKAVVAHMGKPVDATAAHITRQRRIDISLLLNCS